MTTERVVREKVQQSAALLVEAALLKARAEAPNQSAGFYRDLLTDGDHFYDAEFEADFWGEVARQTFGQTMFE